MSYMRQFRKAQAAKRAGLLQRQNERLREKLDRSYAFPVLGVFALMTLSFAAGALVVWKRARCEPTVQHTTALPAQQQETPPGVAISPACVSVQIVHAFDGSGNRDTLPAIALFPCPGSEPAVAPGRDGASQ